MDHYEKTVNTITLAEDTFIKKYDVFSANVEKCSRFFFTYQCFNEEIFQNRKDLLIKNNLRMFANLNHNAQFWKDYGYKSLLSTVILIGCIFDDDPRTYSISKLVNHIQSHDLFNNELLKKRKYNELISSNVDVNDYITNSHSYTKHDYRELKKYVGDTRKLWEEIKDIRRKIFAHQEILPLEEEVKILKNADKKKIENIIIRLLTIKSLIFHSYYNGHPPYYSDTSVSIKEKYKAEISKLLDLLSVANL